MELFGYSAEEFSDLLFQNLIIHPDDRDTFSDLVSDAAQNKNPTRFFDGRTKSGRSVKCKWQCKFLSNGKQQPYLLIMVENISKGQNIESQLNRQIQYLRALRTIDLTISGSMDIRTILQVVLKEAMDQLHMSAAVILTYDPSLNLLKFAAGRGLQTNAIESTSLHLGMGYAGQAAFERRMIQVPELNPHRTDFLHLPGFHKEDFKSYYCVPLISKGMIQGVLESFHRNYFVPDNEWLDFFEALGGQAAIAIEGAKLFSDLQRSNLELNHAYDATLEGWSRALDLRDRDTEGHTRRVTDLTEQLALAMNIDKAERIDIRRGALLHDIGKLGIPDSILLKQGELTTEEWAIVRRHPILAFEMLKPITYLAKSLDIPYCHHERWDGQGYPRGLSGTQIPLAARIFAVVDVFDALTNDRPYRRAWSVQKALEYMEIESSKRFDPTVLNVFLQIIKIRENI